jgi:hypothetical protein
MSNTDLDHLSDTDLEELLQDLSNNFHGCLVHCLLVWRTIALLGYLGGNYGDE